MKVKIQKIAQTHEIDTPLIAFLSLDHFHFHNCVENLVPDIVVVIENSIQLELTHAQDTLNFLNTEEVPDLLLILL